MSRSVTTPTRLPPSVMGMNPMPSRFMRLATCWISSFGLAVEMVFAIASLTFTLVPPVAGCTVDNPIGALSRRLGRLLSAVPPALEIAGGTPGAGAAALRSDAQVGPAHSGVALDVL